MRLKAQFLGIILSVSLLAGFVRGDNPTTRRAAHGMALFHFNNAPWSPVLDFLTEATKVRIVQEIPVEGRTTLVTEKPIALDDAVKLVKLKLRQDGFEVADDGVRISIRDRRKRPSDDSLHPEDVPRDVAIQWTDARGDPLRVTAIDFLTSLAEGDDEVASELFVGTGEQKEFFDACVAGVKASRQYRRALAARFPKEEELQQIGVDYELHRLAHVVNAETFKREGDEASMTSAPTVVADGLQFKLVKNRWKVSSLTVEADADAHVKFTRSVAMLLDQARQGIEHGDDLGTIAAKLKADYASAKRQEDSAGLFPFDDLVPGPSK